MTFHETFAAGSAPIDGQPDRPFTISDLFRVARQRRRLILQVAAGVIALAAIVLMLLPTVYSATAVVMIDQRKNNVADASAVLSNLPTDPSSLQNQIQILTSRDLAGTVVDKLHLERDPEFDPALKHGFLGALPNLHTLLDPLKWFAARPQGATEAAQQRAKVIDNVLHDLSVSTVGLSASIAVRFDAHTAEKSAHIANAFADAYVAQQIQTKTEAASQATKWLTARVNQLSDQVQAAETAVAEYKAKHHLSEGADGLSLNDQQLAAINTQLVQARADLAAKEATYGRIKALIAQGRVADASQVVSSRLIIQLRTQEATLLQQEAELATKYGPKHPKMIAIESQRRDLEAKLRQEVARIAGSLQNDVDVARAQVASLQSSFDHAERVTAQQNLATVKLKALQAEAASTQSMYQTFVTRLRQTQDNEAIQVADARVISPAPVPNGPASPHRFTLMLAAVPAGLILGLIAALLAERFGMAVPVPEGRRVPPGAAGQGPGSAAAAGGRGEPSVIPPAPSPVLARIPDAASVRAADFVIDAPQSDFAQGMRGLLRRLMSPAHGARPRVVAVTAPDSEESKTAVALGLARTAAHAGWRTVLIDGDLARAPAARALGYRAAPRGIVEAVRHDVPLSRCFLKDPRSPLLLLTSFTPLANLYAFLASAVTAQLFAHLRQCTDLIVIDATALSSLNETYAIARLADAVVLVADPRRNADSVLHAAGRTLSAMQAPSVGVVLAG